LWLFGRVFDCGVLVLQREFGERLVAGVGDDAYGWLSVVACYFAEVEVLDEVSKECFFPEPRVDSVVVRLKPRVVKPFEVWDVGVFVRVVRVLFTERNRKVRNGVLPLLRGMRGDVKVEKIRELLGSVRFCGRRVRELCPEDFGVLANVFSE
jgi:16S rRNA (adenine1518-N6/adenine1519-N6)-dimethyltransferase